MNIPTEDVKVCRACGTMVVEATTNRTRQGQPERVLLLPDADVYNFGLPSEQYALTKLGNTYRAGQPARAQRAAMLNAGQHFHLIHTPAECKKLAKAREGRR